MQCFCVWMSRCEQEQQLLGPTESLACICCLTCCLDKAGIAEPLLYPAGLARGHLCSWKDLQLHADSSFSRHDSHHSKSMHTCTQIKYIIFAQTCSRKTLKILVHHQEGTTRVFIPLKKLIYPRSKNRGQNWLYMKGVITEYLTEIQYTLPIGEEN